MSPASASPPSPPAAKAVREAFAPDLEVLKAADELAARLAAGNLTKAETPSTIRATFDAAGIDEAGAETEVERHRKMIEARRRIAAARRARTEISRIEARRKELLVELEGHQKRIHSELRDLRDAQREPDALAGLEALARRALRTKLLPRYIQTELARISVELSTLAPHIQRLEQLRPFKPATVSADFRSAGTTPTRHQAERDRIARQNADGQKQHENLVRWLQDRKAQAHRLQERVEQLRGMYLP